jgi:SAM-dependent methyltransferase
MSEARTGQVSTAAAELYERFFVPALFGQWPARLLDRAGVRVGDTVLDLGCGTGVLARAALGRLGATGAVVGVDPNAGMLAVARRTAPEVTWLAGSAERLPLEANSVDVVASQFALMFFADRQAAAREVRRVLRPGGRVVLATWAELDASPGYAAMVALLRRVVGDSPAEALLAPFGVGTEAALQEIVEPAFPGVQVETWEGTARFPSLQAWLTTDVKAWTLDEMITDRQFTELLREAPEALARFCADDGSVAFPAPAVVAIASAD